MITKPLSNPSYEDLKAALEELCETDRQAGYVCTVPFRKVTVCFNRPVDVPVNRYHKKTVTSISGRFFLSTHNYICFTPNMGRTSGWFIKDFCPLAAIVSINLETEEDAKQKRQEAARKLIKRAHKNFDMEWLRECGTLNDPNSTNVINPGEHFLEWEIDGLKRAFDNCEEYKLSHRAMGPGGRDISIHVRPSQNNPGKVQAWYSSEFPGCGNGDYYVLISPTCATFGERD